MSASSAQAIGVVGAAGSGIAVATSLQRAGLDFEVLEARDGVGGSWRYDPDGDGSACYASLVANTSKLRMQILGRKIGGPLWQYASHSEMRGYFESIADSEGLRPHLRLGWRVATANHADGAWTLRSANGEERRYRALICALGVNGRPRWASLTATFPASSSTVPRIEPRSASRTATSSSSGSGRRAWRSRVNWRSTPAASSWPLERQCGR